MRPAPLLPTLVISLASLSAHAAAQCPPPPPPPACSGAPATYYAPDSGTGAGNTARSSGAALHASSGAASASGMEARSRVVRGAATGRGQGGRGANGRAAQGLASGATANGGFAPSSWQTWWTRNRDAYLWDDEGHAVQATVTSTAGMLSGRGRRVRPEADRPSRGTIYTRIVPLLLDQLESEGDGRVTSAALISLGRAVDPDLGAPVEETLLDALDDGDDRVRMAAAVGLGLLGSRTAGLDLMELVSCSQAGHDLVGQTVVSDRLRAVAALALALGDHPQVIPRLMHAMDGLPDSQRDLKAAIITSLGQMPSAQSPGVQEWLLEKLVDRRLDPVIQSSVPTALARHGDPAVVARLLEVLAHPDTDRVVAQSLVLGLGALARASDADALEALAELAEDGRDPVAREFAWIALARAAARPGSGSQEAISDVARLLARELRKPGRHTDRPFVALAAGLFGRQQPTYRPELQAELLQAFEDVHDPDLRGALAVSLGLLGDRSVGRSLRTALNETHDETFSGHLAVALGLVGYREADAQLRELASRPGTRLDVRDAAALGLRLLGDTRASGALGASLASTANLSDRDGMARALGTLRDVSAVNALDELLSDGTLDASSRSAACSALGGLAEKTVLPWRARLEIGGNYVAAVADLDVLLDG